MSGELRAFSATKSNILGDRRFQDVLILNLFLTDKIATSALYLFSKIASEIFFVKMLVISPTIVAFLTVFSKCKLNVENYWLLLSVKYIFESTIFF